MSMNLPHYFLADMPPEAEITPTLLHENCAALRRNRELSLARRSTEDVIRLLVSVAKDWLKADFPLRRLALEPRPGGFPPATLARGLDTFFAGLTPGALHELVEQDLGSFERRDQFEPCPSWAPPLRKAMGTGPELILQVGSEIVPTTAWTVMVLGLLARSAQFIKCEPGQGWLPRLLAHSIHEADPPAGACLEVAEWGGNHHLDDALFETADCVIASGGDRFLSSVRLRAPETTRFVACRRGVSFGYVSADMLSSRHAQAIATDVAADIAAWNQYGSFAPHVIYAQKGGALGGETFADLLAEELASWELRQPRGEIPAEAAAEIQARRSVYAMRARDFEAARANELPRRDDPGTAGARNLEATRCWNSLESDAWSVVYESDPRFQQSCLNRFVYVKPVADLAEALRAAGPLRGSIAAVGLAAPDNKLRELAAELARWGVQRVCPLGQMQSPPLACRHGGRPSLADLVTWTDWETGRAAPGAGEPKKEG